MWTKLHDVYAPASLSGSFQELETAYHECTLSPGQDPNEFLDTLFYHNLRLKQIDVKYERNVKTLKVHILGSLPKEYSGINTKYRESLGGVLLDMLHKDICGENKSLVKQSIYAEGGLIMNVTSHGTFKGKCRKCGK